jgi:hypothetical protein
MGDTLTLSKILFLVEDLINVFITLATISVVAFIVYAGFKMATSRGNEAEFKKGKEILFNAIIGGVVIFGVGIIVRTIAAFGVSPTNILR